MTGGEWRHAEEISTDVALARRLVDAQFPQWSGLPLVPVEAASTDNALYRLGDDMAARLPRRASAVAAIDKEHEWLPRLAPHLPLAAPTPVAKGAPGLGYPFPWGIVRWLEGEALGPDAIESDIETALGLADLVDALRRLDTGNAPAPGAHNFWRGAPLQSFDAEMRRRFDWLSNLPDIAAIVGAWERDLATPAWAGPGVWIHGDLKGANLLRRSGRLSSVIDWSAAAVGDPVNDVAAAWTVFAGEARAVFRAALAVDDATWRRGRAWALVDGVFGLSYYRGRNDALATAGRQVIEAVLADPA